MEIAKYASKYEQWKEAYSWKECKTDREEYGKFLCSFLTSSVDCPVVNLDGSWGTGKTELLRRLYVELAEQEHPVVYIDAWESDFSHDALAVVCSELLQQLDSAFDKSNLKIKNAFDKLKSHIGTCLQLGQGACSLVGEEAASKTLKGANELVKTIPDYEDKSISGENIRLVEDIQKSQLERVQAMREIKKQLSLMADLLHEVYELKKPIIVLVDELDRCRPSYAIEMLEVIKHFFETQGCVFLVATDTNALQHSIKAIYGQGFDSKGYLHRFFNRRIVLPRVPIETYLESKNISFPAEETGVVISSFKGEIKEHLVFFGQLFNSFNMRLRGIDQAIQKFSAILSYLSKVNDGTKTVINGVVLIAGIVEESMNNAAFKARNNDEMSTSFEYFKGNQELLDMHFALVIQRDHLRPSSYTITTPDPSANKYLYFETDEFNSTALRFMDVGSRNKAAAYYKNPDVKYWLWEDYRKIIELSGHIK